MSSWVAALAYGLRFDEPGKAHRQGGGTNGADRGGGAGALSRAGRLRGREEAAGPAATHTRTGIGVRMWTCAGAPASVVGLDMPADWPQGHATGFNERR
jgi:hypothetical protein